MAKSNIEKHKLYNGNIILAYDPDSHIYSINEKIVYGVTNILSILDKPALMYWAVNETIKYYQGAIKPGEEYGEIALGRIHANAKYAHRASSEEGKMIGSWVHDWIEKFIIAGLNESEFPKRPKDEILNKCIDAFFAWTKEHKVRLLESERIVYSERYEYAGTLDTRAIVDEENCVIDFKVSSGIYDEYWMQVAAYLSAWEEENEKTVDKGYVIRIDKVTGEFEAQSKSREELRNYFEIFKGAHQVYKFRNILKDESKDRKND